MANFPQAACYRILPSALLPVVEQFIEQYAQQHQGTLVTGGGQQAAEPSFWLLVASQLTVLLTVEPTSEPNSCSLGLTFDGTAIAPFIQRQRPSLPADKWPALEQIANIAPSPAAQSDFTIGLLAHMSQAAQPGSPGFAACQPVQAALDQQQDRSLLLNQVVTKIRQSLDLDAILATTVAEVCQFLKADRLLIYQFDLKSSQHGRPMATATEGEVPEEPPIDQTTTIQHNGYITYESRADLSLSSVLNYTETRCFNPSASHQNRYQLGQPFAIDDIEATYQHAPCLLNFLRQNQVKSKLVAPILVNHEPWGLLIAHQCSYQRQWESWELEFLQHIAEHLAVAINQAQLYSQLQRQTQNLEICVVERTHDLRDALAAAQSASRAKSEFLATMSHELRTPLTCIIGMSATLLRWSFGDLSPRQRDYLDTIHKSGEHLLALINDILELSKIESGRTVLDVCEFSLANLVRQSFDRFRNMADDQDIHLLLDIKVSDDQDVFAADPQRVRQILANLLSNAIKFTPAGGRVILRARMEQHMAVLQVEDTGIGIPEGQQPLLFEKFQQLENARQRQYQGTGLGLALTKQLVDLHGGTVNVTSKLGMGSIFTVRLPPQRWIESAQQNAPVPVQEPILGRVVLVEDQEESASLICDMLTAAEYQVIWVIEGSQVLDQVELLQPMAVIVNVNLTGTDGYGVIESLRRYVSTLKVRVLALIDQPDAAQSARAFSAGADEVLAKPIIPESLLSAIMSLSASHQS